MAGPTRISQLTDGSPVQSTDQIPIARGSGASGYTYKTTAGRIVSDLLTVQSSPTVNLIFDSSSRTLSADANTSVNTVNSPTINLDWNSSTRTLSANTTFGGSWMLKSSAYTAVNNDRIAADTSSAAFTITLPASPSFGTNVTIIDAKGTWDTNNLTVARNGSTIEGLAEDLTCEVEGDMVLTLLYNGTTWKVYA